MIKAGKKVENFLIKKEIGRGGMGTIFFAIDTMLNREVALKVVHPQYADNAQLMERFKIEAMTQAKMNHPNIVMVYSFNKIEGEYIIAMEYIAGESLKEMLSKKKVLSVQEAIHYVNQVLKGLQYAHTNNVIHRDIKPANILISGDDQIKISDFGIAKVFGSQGLTKTGMLIGTPWYTSPEQILGEKIDFRTDLYSVGITFYEMLTGRLPFDAETNSDFQVQKAHLETPPIRPSIYNTEIGTKIEKVILRSLSKKPEKRFQNPKEMMDKLIEIENNIKQTTLFEVSDTGISQGRQSKYKPGKKSKAPILIFSFLFLVLAMVSLYFLVLKDKTGSDTKKTDPVAVKDKQGQKPDPVIKEDNKKSEKENKTDEIKQSSPLTTDVKSRKKENIRIKKEDNTKQKKDSDSSKITDKTQQTVKTQTDQQLKKDRDKTKTQTPVMKIKVKKDKISDPKPVKKTDKTTSKTTPAVNLEVELFKIKKLVGVYSFKKAETAAEKLLTVTDSARAYSIAGSIKLFLLKYQEAFKLWEKCFQNNGTIRIRVIHSHGSARKGCSGYLFLRKNTIMFRSSAQPGHNFTLTKGRTQLVEAIESVGITLKGRFLNGTKSNVLSVIAQRDNDRKDRFISYLINQFVLEKK